MDRTLAGATELERSPIAAVVDLAAEMPLPVTSRRVASCPVLDLTMPPTDALAGASRGDRGAARRRAACSSAALGYSRSACAVAAWLLATGRAPSVDAALLRIRAARAQVVLDAGHAALLAPLARAR